MPGVVPPNHSDGTWTSPSPPRSIADLPVALRGPLVWRGSDFDGSRGLPITTLSSADVTEIRKAGINFTDSGLERTVISRETFPLSTKLAETLDGVSETLHNGVGFAIVRGLSSEKGSHESNIVRFAGVASYIAKDRQDFCHIYDKEPTAAGASGRMLRPPNRSVAMDFHTDVDAGPILAFYMQSKAKSGGLQRLASIWTVYNALMAKAPEVIETLIQSWRFEMPWSNGTETINRPLLYHHANRVLFTFATAFIKGSVYDSRLPDCPPLTQRQEAAIKAVVDTCWEHAVEIDLEPGDLLLVNNFALLHQRDAFVDDATTEKSRHLLCLMLQDPQRTWPHPPELKLFIDARFAGPGARLLPTVDQWEAFRSEAGGRPRAPQQQGSASRSNSTSGQSTQSSQYSSSQFSSSQSQAGQYPPRQQSYSSASSSPQSQYAQSRTQSLQASQDRTSTQAYQATSYRSAQEAVSQPQQQRYQPSSSASRTASDQYQQPMSPATTSNQGRRQEPSGSASQTDQWSPKNTGGSANPNAYGAYAEKHD